MNGTSCIRLTVMTMSSTEQERRLTPTERLHEVTMTALSRRPSEPESSVTITRNARGVFQFEVTVRGPDIDTLTTQADAIVAGLVARYPYPEGGPA
jgi:hypothetical protein